MNITRHITIAGILLAAGVTQAADFTVPSAATPTLEFALEAPSSPVQDGDTLILTDAGFYFSSYTVSTPNLTIRAADGQDITLDALGLGSVIEVGAAGTGLVLEDLTITGGASTNDGGGVSVVGAAVTLRRCRIIDNEAVDDGGGASFHSGAVGVVEDCLFEGNFSTLPNSSDNGGGLYAFESTMTVTGSVFRNNTANSGGGGMNFNDCQVTVSGCLSEENASASSGAGGAFVGGTTGTVTDSIFRNNQASNDGGGIIASSSPVDFVRCEFLGNTAADQGGGIIITGETSAEADFFSCVIANNTAQSNAGGVLAFAGPDGIFRNCTIYGNTSVSGNGGGLINLGGAAGVRVRNCIIRNNTPNQYATTGSNLSFYSNVSGGELANNVGTINEDPMFVDAAGGDFRLMAGSPSIDAGDATYFNSEAFPTDLDGNARVLTDPAAMGVGVPIMALFVDQGAFEFQPVVAGNNPCVADLTTTGATLPGNPGFAVPDGVADLDDLGYFLNFWLDGCP